VPADPRLGAAPGRSGAGPTGLSGPEDLEAIRAGRTTPQRRAIRVRRLAQEAHGQEALLSQTDLALLLGSSQKTISTTVVNLREHGELLPLRGYLADMGRWPTHKQAVIRLYLQGSPVPTSPPAPTTPPRRSTAPSRALSDCGCWPPSLPRGAAAAHRHVPGPDRPVPGAARRARTRHQRTQEGEAACNVLTGCQQDPFLLVGRSLPPRRRGPGGAPAAKKRRRTTWRPPSGGAESAEGERRSLNEGPPHEVRLQ
jgi:hypothetical protein